jgi:indolepyruvate ferredoxin oxidoreductase beta subunit
MKSFNIYIIGVGGQGIGLLSQALLRGIYHAGIPALAVDTHGLAQRGGIVVSQIRCGDRVHSPLIMKSSADLVLGMEIHEAARGASLALKKGGTLVFPDVSWQPLPVRLGQSPEITAGEVIQACTVLGAVPIRLELGTLPDARMQNMALLGTVSKNALIPGVSKQHYKAALEDLLSGGLLKKNRAVFDAFAA